MSDISGFPPSASDYVLSEDMFTADIQKATNPRDRAKRQRAVRKVVQAFNKAKLSLSLWSLSMLWNYLRTTDWVCSERDVNKHPNGKLLLHQDPSSRWPMAWYGLLFVIQSTCHRMDQIDKIHREHASLWGYEYHENRPFYPDIYPDNSKNIYPPASSEYSVAPSTLTLDSGYSQEPSRGRSPPRPGSKSPTPTLADYDIVDPLHLEEAMPPAAVNQQTRPVRASPEVPPAKVDRVVSPPLKKPTQTARTSPKASPCPSHAGPASSSSLPKHPEDPVHTDRWDDFNRFRTSMSGSSHPKSSIQPARAGHEVPRPAQVDRAMSPIVKKPTQTARTNPKASPCPSHAGPASSSSLIKPPADPVYTDRWDNFNQVRTSMPGSYPPESPTQPARASHKVPRPTQVEPTMPPPINQPVNPVRASIWEDLFPAGGPGSYRPWPTQPALAGPETSRSAEADPTVPPPPPRSRTAVPDRTDDDWSYNKWFLTSAPGSHYPKWPAQPALAGPETSRSAKADPTIPPPRSQTTAPDLTDSFSDLKLTLASRSKWLTSPAHTGPETSRSAKANPTIPPPRSQTAVSNRTSSEVTPRPGHVGLALPPPADINPATGFACFEEDRFRPLFPTQFRPPSARGHQPMQVHRPSSIVTNPPSLRECPPHFGDLPSLRLGHNPRPAGSGPDAQSCIIQATQAAREAIELSQKSLHHVRRLEAFSNNMSNYIQQSVMNAEQSRNFMESSAVTTKGMEDDIRGSKATIEAAMTTANRALGLVERLSQYFTTKP